MYTFLYSTCIRMYIYFNRYMYMKESKSVGLEKEDALNRVRWRMGVAEIAVSYIEWGKSGHPHLRGYWSWTRIKIRWWWHVHRYRLFTKNWQITWCSRNTIYKTAILCTAINYLLIQPCYTLKLKCGYKNWVLEPEHFKMTYFGCHHVLVKAVIMSVTLLPKLS